MNTIIHPKFTNKKSKYAVKSGLRYSRFFNTIIFYNNTEN
nr:MAG TPA: hypothetical protein [Bacteriophage sp.]